MVEQKSWYQSRTIWGSLITVSAILLSQVGFEIDSTIQQQIIDLIINGSAVLGSAIAIFGRVKAKARLSR